MGKRELLLVVVFVVLGIGVYQVTAPAAPADAPGFSIERMVNFAKAHFNGARARRTITRTVTQTLPAGVAIVGIDPMRGNVVVEGSDRPDVEVRLEAGLAGMDDADLDRQAKQLEVTLVTEGDAARVRIAFQGEGRRPKYDIHLALPRHLKVELSGRATAEVRDVAGIHLAGYSGELRTEAIAGPITGDARELSSEFGEDATIDLKLREGRLRAESPRELKVDCERTTIEVVDAAGPLTFQEDYCRMNIRGTGGPIKVTGDGGTIDLRQVEHPLTIEADRLTVNAELTTPQPTTIAVEDDTVEVELPRDGGVMLEARAVDAELRLPQGLTATVADRVSSIKTAIAGGGPLVKIDLTRGMLRIRGKAIAPES
ncbi:MAG TPA: hypothetical protein VMF13_09720 [Luteitalea sp.]|nr:hypothetical protein [Luteitalea sp.]